MRQESATRPRRFILASGSPRRRRMLEELGARFEVIVPGSPEDERSGETPEEHTLRLANEKAQTVAADDGAALVLGVDTIVVIDGAILGKPADEAEAERMLSLLAGRTHTVITSYALLSPEFGVSISRAVTSRVTMRPLTGEQIRRYIATGEPMDKAGAYAIQGVGASLITRVEGSYSSVVGLPLAELAVDIEELFGPNWLSGER